MGAPTKPKRKKSKSRKPVRRVLRKTDFSGLPQTQLRSSLNEHDVQDLVTALMVITDHMPEISFPYGEYHYIGEHPYEKEVMFFFPGIEADLEKNVHKSMTIMGQHFVVAAFPDTASPIAETGLMFVCRRLKALPSFIEEAQFVIDSIDGNWIVGGGQ